MSDAVYVIIFLYVLIYAIFYLYESIHEVNHNFPFSRCWSSLIVILVLIGFTAIPKIYILAVLDHTFDVSHYSSDNDQHAFVIGSHYENLNTTRICGDIEVLTVTTYGGYINSTNDCLIINDDSLKPSITVPRKYAVNNFKSECNSSTPNCTCTFSLNYESGFLFQVNFFVDLVYTAPDCGFFNSEFTYGKHEFYIEGYGRENTHLWFEWVNDTLILNSTLNNIINNVTNCLWTLSPNERELLYNDCQAHISQYLAVVYEEMTYLSSIKFSYAGIIFWVIFVSICCKVCVHNKENDCIKYCCYLSRYSKE